MKRTLDLDRSKYIFYEYVDNDLADTCYKWNIAYSRSGSETRATFKKNHIDKYLPKNIAHNYDAIDSLKFAELIAAAHVVRDLEHLKKICEIISLKYDSADLINNYWWIDRDIFKMITSDSLLRNAQHVKLHIEELCDMINIVDKYNDDTTITDPLATDSGAIARIHFYFDMEQKYPFLKEKIYEIFNGVLFEVVYSYADAQSYSFSIYLEYIIDILLPTANNKTISKILDITTIASQPNITKKILDTNLVNNIEIIMECIRLKTDCEIFQKLIDFDKLSTDDYKMILSESIKYKQCQIIEYLIRKQNCVNNKELIMMGCESGIDLYYLNSLVNPDAYFFSEIYPDALNKCVQLNHVNLINYLTSIKNKYKSDLYDKLSDDIYYYNNSDDEGFEESD